MDTPIRIVLIPHCASIFNEQKRLQGQLNSALSQRGICDAHELAAYFKQVTISAVHTSDLLRCLETARVIANNFSLTPIISKNLRGRHYGYLQGMTYNEILISHPNSYKKLKCRDLLESFSDENNDGESLLKFNDRIKQALQDSINFHLRSNQADGVLAIVCHGGAIDSMMRLACKIPLSLQIKSLWAPKGNYFMAYQNNFTFCNEMWR